MGVGTGTGTGIGAGVGSVLGASVVGDGTGSGIGAGVGSVLGASVVGAGTGSGIGAGVGSVLGASVVGVGTGSGIGAGVGSVLGASVVGVGTGSGIGAGVGSVLGASVVGVGSGLAGGDLAASGACGALLARRFGSMGAGFGASGVLGDVSGVGVVAAVSDFSDFGILLWRGAGGIDMGGGVLPLAVEWPLPAATRRPRFMIITVTKIRNDRSTAIPIRASPLSRRRRARSVSGASSGLCPCAACSPSACSGSTCVQRGFAFVGGVGVFDGRLRMGHRSATLNFALRDRGLAASSAGVAVMGFRVKTWSLGSSRKVCLTRRSSSEWKLMATARPPGLSTSARVFRISSRCSSSLLTAMRKPWNVRVAGSIAPHLPGMAAADDLGEPAGRRELLDPSRFDDPTGNAPAMPFFSEFVNDPRKFLFIQRIDQVGRAGDVGIGVEPHVERAVVGEAEAAMGPSQLIRRQPQIEHDPIHRIQAEFCQNVRNLRIRDVDQSDGQSARRGRGEREHLRIAIEPDHPPRSAHALGQGTGMPPAPAVPSTRIEPSHGASHSTTSSTSTGR